MKAILPNGYEVDPEPYGMLYYGTDKVDIQQAFSSGIPLKGLDRRLYEHVKQNPQSAFRGTTVLANVNQQLGQGAIHWANVGGWVYEIGPMLGWDPEKLLEGQVGFAGRFTGSPYAIELETSVPSRIAPHQIHKAGVVVASAGCLVVRTWTYNPNYQMP
ncbi:hypothetical protein ACVBEG_17010 [Pseudomonas sp. GG8]